MSARLRLRVASYNIHRCVGADGLYLPTRIAGVLTQLQADIIGLQEVAAGSHAPRAEEQLELLARLSGLHRVFGATMRRSDGGYGNALLSRYPIREVRSIDLSYGPYEPRGAIDADVDCDGHELRVLVTHLGLRAGERSEQVRRLLGALGAHRGALIVMGDFNEWSPASTRLRRMRRRLGRAYARPTFPAWRPLFPLDRIWVLPKKLVVATGRHHTPLARVASDHLPVWTALQLDGELAPTTGSSGPVRG
ncbi:MAG: endonuclease/exonuclease/phosphatase family protein [Acidobacteria bacterium]|nr:endonuclease/exonuclease/phosphatase family protein [Acidobacteriota bacterium]